VTKRSARDVELAAAKVKKTDTTFRSEVEKEKERIRSTALEEIKAEEGKNTKEIEATSTVVTSSSEDSAPPYAPLKLK
jgi:hypothetical protein